MLQRAKSKMLVFLTAIVLAICSVFTGMTLISTPKASADTTEMTYVDTEVDSIKFLASTKVILAFSLTVSDYDDFDPVKDFNSENPAFGEGTDKCKYITSLSYWKNFKDMNSKGATFVQNFAYWNGGFGDSYMGAAGKNAVGHLTSIEKLEYGFMIQIPAGTTFPSWEYAQTNCKSEPKAYRTTTDVAFLYNGSAFIKVDYKIGETRTEALAKVGAVDYSLYYQAEQAELAMLVQATKNALNSCITVAEVEKEMYNFETAKASIKTIAYYEQLTIEKNQVKQSIEAYFNTLSESAYGAEEWVKLSKMKADSVKLIDEATDMDAVVKLSAGILNAAKEVLTEEEKPAFVAFVAAAVQNVEGAFNAGLYREAEAAQGAAIVAEGKALLEAATTYSEAEAIELAYLAKIDALKTAAEWDAEEQPQGPAVQPEQPSDETPDDAKDGIMAKLGCGSSIMETLAVISLAAMATLILIVKNKKRMDM